MDKHEDDEVPGPPDFESKFYAKIGMEYLNEHIDDQLVDHEADSDKMKIRGMLVDGQ